MKKALLIIDVQETFHHPKWGKRNNPDAEENMKLLLNEWRHRDSEVIFIKHLSKDPQSGFHPDHEGSCIKKIVKPLEAETVMTKEVNSAFIGTSLKKHLDDRGITEVVITGLTTPHCISTTTRMSENLGYQTYLVSDATAAFDMDYKGRYIDSDTVHTMSLAALDNEFATVLTTEELLERL
ncbi:cysteine hydrolase family protein [Rossellomorea sp. AcN35-11]|nr:cysteine hydrolase [Rossellomorea aquimaris]WJV29627.1 cysteine hydrolase family protein [Rossellomorea sp. AcN35-11]